VNQDYPHVEYIILDGGSADGSVDIIKKYEGPISYWKSEPDNGQADAIRKGFAMAKGEILCWLNADDLFLPGALRAVADFFCANPAINAVSAGGYLIDVNGRFLNRWPPPLSFGMSASFDQMKYIGMGPMIQAATFWRKPAYEKVGGIDPDLEIVMDRDLFLRLAQLGKFGNLRKFVACFRYYKESKGQVMQNRHPQEVEILARRYGYWEAISILDKFKYMRYRVPRLSEKLWLTALYSFGLLPLPSAIDVINQPKE